MKSTAILLILVITVLLAVRGQERSANYKNACKCQCKDLTTDIERNGKVRNEGNCKTPLRNRYWCYVDPEAARHCGDARDAFYRQGEKWSNNACYTPAPGEGPCVDENSLETFTVDMCAIYNVNPENLSFEEQISKIKRVCFFPGDGQPNDCGRENEIDTPWGSATPCYCLNPKVDSYQQDVTRKYGQNQFVYCNTDQATGSPRVAMSTSGILGAQKRLGKSKAYSKCEWRRRPRRGGRWRCVRV